MINNSEKILKHCAKEILIGSHEDDSDFPLRKVAISVFDQWLGADNLHMLDCKDLAEREDRNRRMLSFWMNIYDRYDVLCRFENDEFKTENCRTVYETKCAYDGNRSGNEFQCILIPALHAIYYENWDDTNVLWYADRTQISPLLLLAEDCGLHSLEFAG